AVSPPVKPSQYLDCPPSSGFPYFDMTISLRSCRDRAIALADGACHPTCDQSRSLPTLYSWTDRSASTLTDWGQSGRVPWSYRQRHKLQSTSFVCQSPGLLRNT